MARTILHCDCNSFYASVETVLNPSLVGVPMAVGGSAESRHGIILAKNDLAKACGVETGEAIWQAKRKCQALTIVPPNHRAYLYYSKKVNKIYENFTDLIEPFGIDESWLDVTGVLHIFGDGKTIADRLRKEVQEELGLTISVGVSFNKIFAKLGSDYKKPNATTVIDSENYKKIVFPLPITDLLMVGKASKTMLDKLQIKTIGDLAKSDQLLLKATLGKLGETIWTYANGLDDSLVKTAGDKREVKSIGNGMTFKRNLVGLDDIRIGVGSLADEVAYRMRKEKMGCTTIAVTIKDPEFKTIVRQKTLDAPTHLAKEIANTAIEIMKGVWNLNMPIRMITITAANLVEEEAVVEQISLFNIGDEVKKEKQERLETTMDQIRNRYGKNAIAMAGIIKNDLGISHKREEEYEGFSKE